MSETEAQSDDVLAEGEAIPQEVDPVPRNDDAPDASSPVFARLENCELSEEVESSIREAEERLEILRTRYSEQHPDMIRATRTLNTLTDAALDTCVERIQAQ